MTTPDPDRKSAPFEWRALTINKVEQIQLARLHEEQDRIERELREKEAREREARRAEAREREGDALEQAWFDEGAAPRETLDDFDTHEEIPPFTPVQRLLHSLAAFARRLTHPTPKHRTSEPPPPLNESPISLSLVLAACAFGGSVYLSLRWVAEVRQAQVTQQVTAALSAPIPERGPDVAPRVNSEPKALPEATAIVTAGSPTSPGVQQGTQRNGALAPSTTATPSSLESLSLAPDSPVVAAPNASPHENIAVVGHAEPNDARPARANAPSRVAVGAPMTPTLTSTVLPNVGSFAPTSNAQLGPKEPAVKTSPTSPRADAASSDRAVAGPRAPVPAADRPPSSGTRVYRAEE